MNKTRLASVIVLALAIISMAAATSSPAFAQAARPDAEVIYGHKHGMALTFDVMYPDGEANGAAVLFMVSGGYISRWQPNERERASNAALLEKGFTVFAVRHGSSPKYVIPEIVGDVRRAVRYIKLHAAELGIDPDRLGVFGGSAGGHLTLMLATTSDGGNPDAPDEIGRTGNRIAAAVAFFPPTDFHGETADTRPGGPNELNEQFPAINFDGSREGEFSPVDHVTPDDPPTLLIHGDQDELVPLHNSLQMRDALDDAQVANELIVLEGAGHGFRGEDAVRARAALVAWFEKYLVR